MIARRQIGRTFAASAFPPSSSKKAKSGNFQKLVLRGIVISGFTGVAFLTYNSFKQSSTTAPQSPVTERTMRPLPSVDDLLSMDEVTRIFKKNEFTLQTGDEKKFDLNSIASNNPGEDYHSQHKSKYGSLILGIFDGHGGPECGAVVSKVLASYIEKHLEKAPLGPSGLPAKESVIRGLKDAFLELDKDICLGSLSSPRSFYSYFLPKTNNDQKKILKALRNAASGSCAIVAYLQGNEVFVANSGDCRAVLGRNTGYNNQFNAIDLSQDQTAKTPTEFSRMCEEHPGEEATIVVRGRVLGGLMPSRAFGDARYKWPLSIQEVINPYLGRRIPPNLLTPPYVTAEPEVSFYERDKSDEFLIIACDGLWDDMSSDTAVKVVKELKDSGYDGNYSTALIQAAISGYGSGGTLLDAARIQHSLSIPSPQSRRYRDDMTVGVLFFPSASVKTADDAVTKSIVPAPPLPQIVPPQIYDWVGVLKNKSKPVQKPKAKL